ncbi:MAG: nuclear transport factor 2 (NTF2) superfamily protein [Lentisphaeria bacterium]|jgi:nuclear transport factor 2 (NTF2) superfamily protein
MPEDARPPLPPFTYEEAVLKVRKAEDAWNGKNPELIAQAYTENSSWRNRDQIFNGRNAIREFLVRKWQRELGYRLVKEIWAHSDNRIAVRFAYEWHDYEGHWFRAYGNENWQFASDGRMQQRHASINDKAITKEQRKFLWPEGVRPQDHPGLTELGL